MIQLAGGRDERRQSSNVDREQSAGIVLVARRLTQHTARHNWCFTERSGLSLGCGQAIPNLHSHQHGRQAGGAMSPGPLHSQIVSRLFFLIKAVRVTISGLALHHQVKRTTADASIKTHPIDLIYHEAGLHEIFPKTGSQLITTICLQ